MRTTSVVSMAGNAVLAAAKLWVGAVAGSMAVLADGVDSMADVIISLIMVVASVIVARPPSRRFPFGLDKVENVATLVLSLIIFYAGGRMLASSVGIIVSGQERALPGMVALWVTAGSIAGKLLLAWYQFRVGRRVESSLIVANARNMQGDVIISGGVLVGLFFTYVLRLPVLDAVVGCAVGLFIIKTAIEIFLDSTLELVDGVKDGEVYRKIFDAVARVPEAHHPHHVRARLIGGAWMIDLDIELDGGLSVDRAHEIAERVEENIRSEVERVYDIEVHIEPLGFRHKREPFGVTPAMLDRSGGEA